MNTQFNFTYALMADVLRHLQKGQSPGWESVSETLLELSDDEWEALFKAFSAAGAEWVDSTKSAYAAFMGRERRSCSL